MKKILFILSVILIFSSCTTLKEGENMINEVEAPLLPELMVCPGPNQDFDSIFTKSNEVFDTDITYVEVITNEKGAEVFLNDQLVGESDIKVLNLKAGYYKLDIIKDGYKEISYMINVNTNKGYVFSVDLTK